MPHSHPFGKEWAQPYYKIAKPQYVVDLACGAGMWYDALAEQTNRQSVYWLGVDIWEPYVDKYSLESRYDSILIKDIREYAQDVTVSSMFERSLAIAGDVLEHMPKQDAINVVRNLKRSFTDVLISTPVIHYEQGALEGNPYEEHVWHPEHEEMLDIVKPTVYAVGDVVGAYWWTE